MNPISSQKSLSLVKHAAMAAIAATLFCGVAQANENEAAQPGPKATSKVAFDVSLPADFARCQQTKQISAYIDSIPAEDISSLMGVQKFLISCHRIATNNIASTRQAISEQESLTTTRRAIATDAQ